jgi:hypothetical protein
VFIVLRFFTSVKRILFKAIQGVSEKSKIIVAALVGRFCIPIHICPNRMRFEAFLKRFKGTISAIFRISLTYIFPIFSPLGARRVYA